MSSYPIPIPGVGTMTSTALTEQQLSVIMQQLVAQCLGINAQTDANAYARVRIDWPPPGQPGWLIGDDIAFIRATEAGEAYNAAHEVQQAAAGSAPTYPEQTIYTRVWEVACIFYGPNSFDHARQVKACLYQDWACGILALSNLYVIPVTGTPNRSPELFANQWWPRTDFSFRMYEQVTDALTKQTVETVEVAIADADGQGSEFVIGS